MKRVGEMTYIVALPPSLSNPHDFFHVSQLRNYIFDLSHIIQLNDVQVRENLIVEASPLEVEDREVKHLREKEIALVKVEWGGPTDGSMIWEQESQMKESYLTLFSSGNFRGRK